MTEAMVCYGYRWIIEGDPIENNPSHWILDRPPFFHGALFRPVPPSVFTIGTSLPGFDPMQILFTDDSLNEPLSIKMVDLMLKYSCYVTFMVLRLFVAVATYEFDRDRLCSIDYTDDRACGKAALIASICFGR
jgi:hypothetical protein